MQHTAPAKPGRTPHVHVDVLIILEDDLGRILLSERANTGYADGALVIPSGHLEPGEDVVQAAVREALEELGVEVDPDDLRVVHVMHHQSPTGQSRVGFFFVADKWAGEPQNTEPDKCAGLLWVVPDDLPENTWPYTAAGISHYIAGTPFSVHGFAP